MINPAFRTTKYKTGAKRKKNDQFHLPENACQYACSRFIESKICPWKTRMITGKSRRVLGQSYIIFSTSQKCRQCSHSSSSPFPNDKITLMDLFFGVAEGIADGRIRNEFVKYLYRLLYQRVFTVYESGEIHTLRKCNIRIKLIDIFL